MKLNEIKNFDNLWEMSELVSNKVNQNRSVEDIIEDIKDILETYSITKSEANAIHKELQKKYIGELLFLLTAITIRDDINVYSALKDQVIENSK